MAEENIVPSSACSLIRKEAVLKQRGRRLGALIGKLPTLISSSNLVKGMYELCGSHSSQQRRSKSVKSGFYLSSRSSMKKKPTMKLTMKPSIVLLRISAAHSHEGTVSFEIWDQNLRPEHKSSLEYEFGSQSDEGCAPSILVLAGSMEIAKTHCSPNRFDPANVGLLKQILPVEPTKTC